MSGPGAQGISGSPNIFSDSSSFACGFRETVEFVVWAHVFAHWCVVGSRTGDGELSLTLQESSVGVDELVRLDITNRDTGHVGGILSRIGVVGWRVLVMSKSRARSAKATISRFPCAAGEACGNAGARINVSPLT